MFERFLIGVPEAKRGLQAAVMRDLLGQGQIDRVLVVAETVGADLDERPSARALLAALPPGRAQLIEGDFSHPELMALCGAGDIVMTQHLHSFIFATMMGTPGLVFSVDGHKVERLVEGLGLPAWMVVDAAGAGAGEIIERAQRLRGARDQVAADLRRASGKARASVSRFTDELAASQPA